MTRSPAIRAARNSWTRILGILGLAVWSVTGCVGTTGHLAAATSRAVDPRAVDFETPPRRHVVGRSCIHVVTVVPLRFPSFGEALDDALGKVAGSDVLYNVVVGYEVFDIPLIYGFACYVVEGDVR